MEMHMIDLLVRNPSVVLQHIVVLCSCCFDELLHHWQDLRKLVVWNIEQLLAMVLGDNQLCAKQPISHPFPSNHLPMVLGNWKRTAWPRERGLISKNASTLSDSKSLKEGISPFVC